MTAQDKPEQPAFTTRRAAFRLWTLAAGLVLGLAGILSLPLIFGDLGADRGVVNWFTIFLGTFASGSLFWWLLIARPRQLTILRGASAGVLASVLAYPLVFLVMFVLLGEVPFELRASSFLSRVGYALSASLFAVAFGGWYTLLLGALVGGLLAFGQQRLLGVTQRTAADLVSEQTERAQAAAHRHPWLTVGVGAVAVVVLIVLALGAWVWFAPLNFRGLQPAASPAGSYAEAVSAVEAMQQAEAEEGVNPLCNSKLLEYGEETENVIVFFHGFTNCPQQFEPLGQQFFEQGYNVFIPRMPHHGLADRMTKDLSKLTAEELARFGSAAVDIAQGLGDRVTVVGLSGGGNVAAWAAQERADVDSAVLIAPMLGILKLPRFSVKPVANLTLTLPNFFLWWDPATKEDRPGPDYAYQRYATRAVGGLMRLGALVDRHAEARAPAAGRIVVVSNEADAAVNNAVLEAVVRKWRLGGSAVETYEFPAEEGLPHDLIDPYQPEQRSDFVYPILIDLIEGPDAGG